MGNIYVYLKLKFKCTHWLWCNEYFPLQCRNSKGDVSSPIIFDLFVYLFIYEWFIFLTFRVVWWRYLYNPDFSDIFCLMYADDIANCCETRVWLQRQVNLIGEFCDTRNIKVNLNKTKIIVFRNGGPLRDYERWHLNGTPIRTTLEYKYMGGGGGGGGLGGSVGCAVRLETRRSRVQPPPRSATFFRGVWSWNIFYGHSLPSADSRRAVVSFWRKNVHNTG